MTIRVSGVNYFDRPVKIIVADYSRFLESTRSSPVLVDDHLASFGTVRFPIFRPILVRVFATLYWFVMDRRFHPSYEAYSLPTMSFTVRQRSIASSQFMVEV
jgi:hypothetical protein